MSGSVTVPGAGGTTITIPTGGGDNTFVAQIIANSIILATTARGGAGVNYTTAVSVGSGQWSLPGAPVGPGSDIAIIPSNASGDITIPSGYAYVIDESPNPIDIHGAGNVQIVSADTSGGSYNLSGQVSLVASGGNNTASIGGGSTTYNVAIGGTGTNSIKATGHGTVSGGTGTNTFIITDTASSGTLVLSNGTDSVLAGGDHVSVIASGSNATLNAGTATGTWVQVEGGTTGDQVIGGTGTTDVSTGGSTAKVLGGTGTLSVQDSGLNDTIAAFGATAASIQAWGKDALIFAGYNSTGTAITVSGGGDTQQGGNLVIGGSGTGTTNVVFGAVLTQVASMVGGKSTIVSVTQHSAHNTVIGGSGALNVTDDGFADVIAPFSAAATVGAFGQSALIVGGSADLVASIGGGLSGPTDTNDTLAAGGGNASIQVGGINALILGNSGSLAVSLTGGNTGATIAGFGASVTDVSVLDVGSGGALVFGGSHALNVNAAVGTNTIAAGAGAASISLGAAGLNNLVFGGSGALTVDSGARGDTIAVFGASAANISVTGAVNLVYAGSNSVATTNVSLNGGFHSFDTVIGGAGTTNVTITGSSTNNVVYGGAGVLNVVDLGTSDVIAAFNASSAAATLGGSGDLYYGGSNSGSVSVGGSADSIVAGSGTLTVTAGSGTSSLMAYGGSGTLDFAGGASAATVFGGPGITSITGGSGGTTLFGAANGTAYYTGNSGGLMFAAGGGNETLIASGSSSNFIAAGTDSSGTNTLVGGSGNDTFSAGAGTDTMTSGSGDNAFAFFAQSTDGKADVVTNWTTNDSLLLIGYSSAGSASSVVQNATDTSGGLTMTLSDNTTITFSNLTTGTESELNGHILYVPS